jgi:uncharacterized membrane protein YoaK (UPF0700 family)
MTSLGKKQMVWAALLSAVAGFVDAVGFIALGGFFVSFMSGNSTRLGVGLIEAASAARLAAILIAAFVSGATAGALLGQAAGRSGFGMAALSVALAWPHDRRSGRRAGI